MQELASGKGVSFVQRNQTLLIMKLTVILLLVGCLQVSARGYTQTITINLQNAPIDKVFEQIQHQTGYRFFYANDLPEKAGRVTIKVANASLEETLKKCFAGRPFTYRIINKVVIVNAKDAVGVEEEAPFIDVKGRVVNERGEAVEGVTVTIKGTEASTVTNKNGEFILTSVDHDAVLVFTHVSLETFEIKVSGKSVLAINLKTKVNALGDVTVTVNTGYEKISKERATGSYQYIDKEELSRRVGPDLLSRMEGVTTGVLFNKSGTSPNQIGLDKNNIQIRGLSTLTSTMSAPLIVLNNFPYEGDINNINPNDVESITILKDAAAASIWGAKAANGVIVITTKTGHYNKRPQLSLNTNFNYVEKPDLFKFPKMSSPEYIDAEIYFFDNGLYDGDLSNNTSYLAVSPLVEILDKRRSGLITAAESKNQIDLLRSTDVRNDFEKYVYRGALQQQYNLNLSGGGQYVKYMVSGGYDKNPNNLVGNTSNRVTLLSNASVQLSKRFDLSLNINYSNISQRLNSFGNIDAARWQYKPGVNMYSYARFSDANGNALPIVKDYRAGYVDTAGAGRLLNWRYSPLEEMDLADNEFQSQELIYNIAFTYKFSHALQVIGSYQYQNGSNLLSQHFKKETYFTRNLVNLFTRIDNDNVTRIVPYNGILDEFRAGLTAHTGRVQANYNQQFAEKHDLTALAGFEIRETINQSANSRLYGYNENYLSSSVMDYITDYPIYGDRGFGKVSTLQSRTMTTDHFVSAFANMSYTFDRRYTASASVRRDASNLFGIDLRDKWKPFWTVGVAWNLSNESFYRLNAINYLKLRGSFGYQGNVNNSISPYTLMSYSTNNSGLNNLPQAYITNPANPGLSWETLKQLNLAADFRFKGDRLAGTVDYFHKRSDNLLLGALNDPTSGVSAVTKNSASLSGTGVELSINSVNINQNGFRWSTEFGFSYVTNKLLDYKMNDEGATAGLFAGGNGAFTSLRIGKSPYTIYSFPFAGLDDAGNPLGYNGKALSSNYQEIFDQLMDTANLVDHGSSIPNKFGFFNNTVSYKGFTLNIGVGYNFGYYIRKSTISYYGLFWSGRGHADFAKRWQKPGDEAATTVPAITTDLSSSLRDNFYASSSVNVVKGDNIRMQYIKASYELVRGLAQKLSIQSAQVYASMNNVGILWRSNREGLDPDYDYGNAAFPLPKTIAVGLNVVF